MEWAANPGSVIKQLPFLSRVNNHSVINGLMLNGLNNQKLYCIFIGFGGSPFLSFLWI